MRGSKAMDIKKAIEINDQLAGFYFHHCMGFPVENGGCAELPDVTLKEALEATEMVKAENKKEVKGVHTMRTTCDDRLIAALFTFRDYETQENDDGLKPILAVGKVALIKVAL